jgi:hypothetical protein
VRMVVNMQRTEEKRRRRERRSNYFLIAMFSFPFLGSFHSF